MICSLSRYVLTARGIMSHKGETVVGSFRIPTRVRLSRAWKEGSGGEVVSIHIGLQLTHRKEDTMHAIWRAVVLGIVVTLGVVLGADIVRVSAQASDARIGTWKLNVAKSKYSPGPAPQSLTLKIEASGQGEKATAEGVNADGKPTMTQYTANFDGKDAPLTGSPNADKVSLKRIDARTTERMDKKGDTVVLTYTRVVSQDGKTMTVTTKGTNAQGQAVDNVAVFEKQ
jgi:hypothetical protein